MRRIHLLLVLVLAACTPREDPAVRDGRLVVAGFDAVMDAQPTTRSPQVEAMRGLSLTDPAARTARDRCIVLFDAIGRASALQDRLEPLASHLDGYVDAGLPVPPTERDVVLGLYREATTATQQAADALAPCTQAIDGLRAHRARRH